LFALTLAAPHPDTITLVGMLHNLGVVTIGNIIGGGVFVGAMYAFLTTKKQDKADLVAIESEPVIKLSAEK
jgi:nitrite transporter NirC